jgi:UDP-N-acetylmuramate dehydrogenase
LTLIERLPKVKGKYRENVELGKKTWFNTGGSAEILYHPDSASDLAYFIKNIDKDIPIFVLGAGSNTLIRDGGIKGVVIKLAREFSYINLKGDKAICGAAALNFNVANFLFENAKSGCEFLSGIPGSIGGGIAMNAGAYGNDFANVLEKVKAISPDGDIIELSNSDIGFKYRGNNLPQGFIFTEAIFTIKSENKQLIKEEMDRIKFARENTQPIHAKTSGSTFKNTASNKAWELIDKAGCRGLKVGNAYISEKHCNFIINEENATAKDIEDLGNMVIDKVKNQSGVTLEWEIERVGEYE